MLQQLTRSVVCFVAGLTIGSLFIASPQATHSQALPQTSAVPSSEIAILRYIRIKKNSYPEFYRQSVENVWPYYEKVGARIIGMWQVTYPADIRGQRAKENADYDEVYLLTRYANLEHWKATRPSELYKLGGAGPDLDRLMEGEKQRAALTIQTGMTVLRGRPAFNGPYFPEPIVEPAR